LQFEERQQVKCLDIKQPASPNRSVSLFRISGPKRYHLYMFLAGLPPPPPYSWGAPVPRTPRVGGLPPPQPPRPIGGLQCPTTLPRVGVAAAHPGNRWRPLRRYFFIVKISVRLFSGGSGGSLLWPVSAGFGGPGRPGRPKTHLLSHPLNGPLRTGIGDSCLVPRVYGCSSGAIPKLAWNGNLTEWKPETGCSAYLPVSPKKSDASQVFIHRQRSGCPGYFLYRFAG
jgi:hypothetical protein